MRRVNTVIGAPIERVEDLRFLRGRGQYLDDLNRPGQWHAAVVRSNVAHGRVRAVDTVAALALPGVKAVVTARDLPRPCRPSRSGGRMPSILPHAQPVMADDVVRYVGEPVAMVLADTPSARRTRRGDRGRYRALPAIADHRASARGRRTAFRRRRDDKLRLRLQRLVGDADAAFRDRHLYPRDASACSA